MGTYVKKSCSKCGFSIQPYTRDTRYDKLKIQNPFSKCPKCGTTLIDKHCKEIVMFKDLDYVIYFGYRLLWDATLLSFLGAFVIIMLINVLFKKDFGNLTVFIITMIPFYVLFFLKFKKEFMEEKEESLKRTRNSKYLKSLLDSNLITKEKYDKFIETYKMDNE